MSQAKKYRLGNQPEEYELSEEYLGWVPEGCNSWKAFHDKLFPYSLTNPETVTLVGPDKQEKVTLTLHHYLMKEAFPLSFYGEERAKDWWNFLMVSKRDTPEKKFVIPMH